MKLTLDIPIRIQSAANLREHWAKRARRVADERESVFWAVMQKRKSLEWEFHVKPCKVTFIRIGPRLLDSDNLQCGFKAIRDELAAQMAMDDADPRIEWVYKQERGLPYACRIEIESA